MKQIPNIFTLLNLFFGCIAIVFALQNTIDIKFAEDGSQFVRLTEKIYYASLFIGIAAVIDFLDGFVARLLGASSEMGKQLDSLADVVSFGVAPSIILYQFLRMSFIRENDGLETSMLWLLPAFIFACAGAYRLARFNLDSEQSYGFKGVPIPAAGLVVASLPLIYWNVQTETVYNILMNKWFLYGIILLLSWLMVSKLPLMALKFKDFSVKNNLPKFILLGITVVAALLLKWLAVPVIFIAYIILSLLYKQK
ncbi:MAG: CDP-diacylglycerol--serine O-phosphatidyltransferase [Chitinophagaceae bacterium]|nr:CDP-diacylglycerol--serine O-phosphatidyltransferase [Chitinophagaceae bacterium]